MADLAGGSADKCPPVPSPTDGSEGTEQERAQIATILQPTKQAHLATLGMQTEPAETATSSSSAARFSALPGNTAPRPPDPSGTAHGDMGAAPISAQSMRPSHDSGYATARATDRSAHTHHSTHRHTQQGKHRAAGRHPGQPLGLQHHQP